MKERLRLGFRPKAFFLYLPVSFSLPNFVGKYRKMTKLSSMKIPVYVLHLIPYRDNIILQNLYVLGAFMKKRCIAILRESAEHPFRHGKSDISLK